MHEGHKHGSARRYRQVVRILFKHGFGYMLHQLGIEGLVPFHWSLFGYRPGHHSQAEHLRLAFEELGATFIKLGQILSTRSDILSSDFVNELSKLLDAVPPEPLSVIEAQIAKELCCPPSSIFASFEPVPLGSASIGQVHAVTLLSGEEAVIKVQRPGIEDLVEEDLAILMDIARLAQRRTKWAHIYDLPGMVEDFADTLRAELDYVREGRNAERTRANFPEEEALQVPAIYWRYTTKRVLTMQRIHGIKISNLEALEEAGIDRRKLAVNLIRMVLKMVLHDGFYHADAHPGNFLIEPGEVIGLLDYGMVGRLDDRTRENLLYLFAAIVDQDTDRVIDRLADLGIVGSIFQLERLKHDIGHIVSLYWGLPVKDIDLERVIDEFLNAARRHQLTVPIQLTLLSKTLMMNQQLARMLDPEFNLTGSLGPYAREQIMRIYSPRHLAEHVLPTILDLSQLAITLPRRADRLLGQLERGNLALHMTVRETEHALDALTRMVTRIILGVLVAGNTLGIAMLLQIPPTNPFYFLVGWLLALALVALAVLGLFLVIAFLRPTHD